MKNMCKRAAALALTLCLMLTPCASLSAWAAETKATATNSGVVDYHLFCDGLEGYTYRGVVQQTHKTNKQKLDTLYNNGTINFTPYTSGGGGTAFFTDVNKAYDNGSGYMAYGPYQGVLMYSGKVGSYMAFKIKSPGAGTYSVSMNYYVKGHTEADYGIYLLPASVAETAVASNLTAANKIGTVSVEGWNHESGGSYSGVANASYQVGSAGEYILVIRAEKDNALGSERIEMSIEGVTFVKNGSAPTLTGSLPIEIAMEDPVRTVSFYQAINGVGKVNGENHEMLYLLFKGSTMWVYDITAGKIHDVVHTYMTSHPSGACIDPNGILWLCGSGKNIARYDPATKEVSRITVDEGVMGSINNLYSVTYYKDGTNERLYFGTCYSAKLGYVDLKTNKTHKLTDTIGPDGYYSAYGGIYIDAAGKYLYTTVDGDRNEDQISTHAVIKVDMASGKVLQTIDLNQYVNVLTGLSNLSYADNKLFITCTQKDNRPLVIDISGSEMKLLPAGAIDGLDRSFSYRMSDEANGKTYLYKKAAYGSGTKWQIHEYDLNTHKVTNLGIVANSALQSIGTVATLEGKTVLIAPRNMSDGTIDLHIYDVEAKKVEIRENIGNNMGNGNSIHSLAVDASGRYIFTGGYGTNIIGIYDVQTGTLRTIAGYSHQTDSLQWYNGFLWVGNYNQGTITRITLDKDMKNPKVEPIMNLMESAFQQKRMLGGLATGDGKVFCGTVPDTGMMGGALTWYDSNIDRLYVAMGDGAQNVYYTDDTFKATVETTDVENVTWYRASDNQKMTWDKTDAYLKNADGSYQLDENGSAVQRFHGLIEDMVINCVVYYNGFIIGTTSKTNGSASVGTTRNAQVFVYDVKNMTLLDSRDLSAIDGDFAKRIGLVNVVAADPYEPGKFWGVASSKLFSFTVGANGKIKNMTEVLSAQSDKTWGGQSNRGHNAIVFDGEYLYAGIYGLGTCMVNTEDSSDYKVLSATPAELMVQGVDGNLYFLADMRTKDLISIPSARYTNHIVAQSVQDRIDTVNLQDSGATALVQKMYDALGAEAKALVDPSRLGQAPEEPESDLAKNADAMIDAIGEVTLQKEAIIQAARDYYDSLPDGEKAKVTKLSVLEAAEEALALLKQNVPQEPPETEPPATEPPATEEPTTQEPTPQEPTTQEPATEGSDVVPEKKNKALVVVLGAAVAVVAAAAVAAIVIRRKKAKTEE